MLISKILIKINWKVSNVLFMNTCFVIGWAFMNKSLLYSEGKQIFDRLLILHICPLAKKWAFYNVNGRFILTVRDRNNNISMHLKKVTNWFALMSEIKYLIPYQSARFLSPRCLPAPYMYKRHLSTDAINQIPNSPPWPRPKSCPRMLGTRL